MESYVIQLGKRIKKCRKAMGFTQAELAEVSGLSPNFISVVERGKSSASAENVMQLCKALDVSADYLLFGEEEREVDIELQQSFMRMNRMEEDKRTNLKEVLAPLIRAIEETDGDDR